MYLSQFNSGRIPAERIISHSPCGCYCIIHFGLNTYTDREWGYGDEDPALFDPVDFDAEKIVQTCKDAGLSGLILVCKHHDGFCLWRTATTSHNISKSPFRNGQGDLVREFADACAKIGLDMGFYVSPWDRNHPDYGRAEYVEVFRQQLRELLSGYGPAFEVWFDGANGGDGYYGGACEKRQIDNTVYYDWVNTWRIVRELQPHAAIFSDVGPDLRWVGNEKGYAHRDCFGSYSPESDIPGNDPVPGGTAYKLGETGHAGGKFFIPPECDFPLRNGWFWHPHEENTQKSVAELIRIYLHSVGCGGFMNIGLAPDRNGVLSENDVKSLLLFKEARSALFSNEVYRGEWRVPAGGDAIVRFASPVNFNLLEMTEDLADGENICDYEILVEQADGSIFPLISGNAVGLRRLKALPRQTASGILIRVTKSRAAENVIRFALYHAVYPVSDHDPVLTDEKFHMAERCHDGWEIDLYGEHAICGFEFIPAEYDPAHIPTRYFFRAVDQNGNEIVLSIGEFSNIRANPVLQKIMLPQSFSAARCRITFPDVSTEHFPGRIRILFA